MEKIQITINHIPVEVEKGTRVIEAARLAHIDIPHLCYCPDQAVKAHCRMCVVEVTGYRKLLAACSTVVWEGMEVFTNTQKVQQVQTGILEMILANHNQNCLYCSRNRNCVLQTLRSRLNTHRLRLPKIVEKTPVQDTGSGLLRDFSKCIRCGRCVGACAEQQGVRALTYAGRSSGYTITTAYHLPFDQTDCILCDQCSKACPVASILIKDDTQKVLDAIQDPAKHVVVQVAPAVRNVLGEEFGIPEESAVLGKMVTALRMMGFGKVFDTGFSADMAVLETSAELLDRLHGGGPLPMITSCSSGWVNYMQKHHPDLLSHLSTAKSPQQIFGALAKTYYSRQAGIPPEDIVTVSIMPCAAKKFEAARPEMEHGGMRDVDIVLTARELLKLIRFEGLEFAELPADHFDSPLGTDSVGAIWGTHGGVIEAVLHAAAETAGHPLPEEIQFAPAPGSEGVREAEIPLGSRSIRAAVAPDLRTAEALLQPVRDGVSRYDLIEVMACPGGCRGKLGQPSFTPGCANALRQDARYSLDDAPAMRSPWENPEVKEIYAAFFEAPLSEPARRLLHIRHLPKEKACSGNT